MITWWKKKRYLILIQSVCIVSKMCLSMVQANWEFWFRFFLYASFRFLSFVDKLMYKSIEIFSVLQPLRYTILLRKIYHSLFCCMNQTEKKWKKSEPKLKLSVSVLLWQRITHVYSGCRLSKRGRCKLIRTDIHHIALVSWNSVVFWKMKFRKIAVLFHNFKASKQREDRFDPLICNRIFHLMDCIRLQKGKLRLFVHWMNEK